jgi:hypothetical protein
VGVKTRFSSLGSMGAFVVYIGLATVCLAIFFLVLKFLAAFANLLGALVLFSLVPLLLIALVFRGSRRFCGRAAITGSYLLGASTWLTATLWLRDLWGTVAVIIGVLMFGVGSVPLGCLALLLHGRFRMLFLLLGQLLGVYALRLLGIWITSKGDTIKQKEEGVAREEEAMHLFQQGREYYDLAEAHHYDPVKALGCFAYASKLMPENTDVHVYLGILHRDGDGVPQDLLQSYEHFSAAAKLGDPNGQRSLAEMYENGDGVPQNRERAVYWYRQAAEQDDSFAQYKLGMFYSGEFGDQPDFDKAALWFRKAAANGEQDAQTALSLLHTF